MPSVGVEFHGSTVYPVDVTDFSQYATTAYGSGAKGVFPFFPSSATVPAFVNAVSGGGFSFRTTPTVFTGVLFRPSLLDGQLKNKLDGTYVVSEGQTPTDTSLPGIKKFHDEVDGAGTPLEYTAAALEAWVGVHVIAQVLANAPGDVVQPKTLIDAMKAAGPIDCPGWTTFDWSKPALPAPLAANFPRYFNTNVWVSKVVDNKLVSAVSSSEPYTGPITLTTK